MEVYAMLRAWISVPSLLMLAAPAWAADLVIVNDAYFSIIHQVYIAPAKSNNWSENKVQGGKIARTERFTISNIAPGVYDLKVIDDDNDTCVFTDINIDQTKEWKLTDTAMTGCVFKSK
jgi:hypothetical protein